MPFPTAQQVNFPACSPHCFINAERQVGKLCNRNVKIIDFTRIGIKPESTAPKADAIYTLKRTSKKIKLEKTCALKH